MSWLSALTLSYSPAWTAPYWQHPSNSTYIYAADKYIRRSTNSGASWGYISSAFANTITSVAHSTANTNKMMAVGSYYDTTPQISISADEGGSWTDITTNITASFTATSIQKVAADPSAENTFYLCRVSYGVGQVLKLLILVQLGLTLAEIYQKFLITIYSLILQIQTICTLPMILEFIGQMMVEQSGIN
ncbi:MAG: hypothetical protein H6613_06890 [Ignavibacteriales bacterium]|nr:hypothetical protein [Ignavibacteriales bacterium]